MLLEVKFFDASILFTNYLGLKLHSFISNSLIRNHRASFSKLRNRWQKILCESKNVRNVLAIFTSKNAKTRSMHFIGIEFVQLSIPYVIFSTIHLHRSRFFVAKPRIFYKNFKWRNYVSRGKEANQENFHNIVWMKVKRLWYEDIDKFLLEKNII